MELVAGTTPAESFDWFFRAEYPQVVRVLSVVLHDHTAAEDLTQEAFWRLHRRWERVARYERPEAWVRRVALNLAFSHRRREARRPALESVATDSRPGCAGDPTGTADVHLDVLTAVRRLPVRQRALVALYHLEDRPVDEVAEVLGMTPGATKVALHRARAQLATLLEDTERREATP